MLTKNLINHIMKSREYTSKESREVLYSLGYGKNLTDKECERVYRDELFLYLNTIWKNRNSSNIIMPSWRYLEQHGVLDAMHLKKYSDNYRICGLTEFKNSKTLNFGATNFRLQEDGQGKLTKKVYGKTDLSQIKLEYDVNSPAMENGKLKKFPDFLVDGGLVRVNRVSTSNEELFNRHMSNPLLDEVIAEHQKKLSNCDIFGLNLYMQKKLDQGKYEDLFVNSSILKNNFENSSNQSYYDQLYGIIFSTCFKCMIFLGILFVISKVLAYFEGLYKKLSMFSIVNSLDWYKTKLVFTKDISIGLTPEDLVFIKHFLEIIAPKYSFKIKLWILSEDEAVEFEIYTGFKIKYNFYDVILKIHHEYGEIPNIKPVINTVYVSLLWIVDEHDDWIVKKNDLENTILKKKLNLVQKSKFVFKSLTSTPILVKTFKRSYSVLKNDETFKSILKKSIPSMDINIIEAVLDNAENNLIIKKNKLESTPTKTYLEFSESIDKAIQTLKIDNRKIIPISEGQKKDLSCRIVPFILSNLITTSNLIGYLPLAQLVNFVYDYLVKIGLHLSDLNIMTQTIVNAIIKNKQFIDVIKKKIGFKDVYNNWSDKGKDHWLIKVENYQELNLIKDQFTNNMKLYLTSHPRDWEYENGNAYGGYDSAYNTVYVKLIDINISNKILFKELGDICLIKKINKLQKIGCKYNIACFKTIFTNYSIQNFENLLYKKREQFYTTIKKIYPNSDLAITNLKIKEGFGLQKDQLNTFLLLTLFLKRVEVLEKNTLLYSNIRLDHRLRYYYIGLYNHMNSKILRYLTQLKPFSIPQNLISDNIKFYVSWQISKSKNVAEGIKKYEKFKNTEITDKNTILEFRNPYNWLITTIAILKKESFSISLDACGSFQQILSIINRDLKLAKFTNIINLTNDILDPYNYIIEKIKVNIPSEFEDFREILLDRKIIKQCVMTYTYGSNAWSIIENLKESGNLKLLKKNKTSIKLFKYIIQKFNEEFPSIKKIVDIVKIVGEYLCKNDKPIYFKYKQTYTKFTTNKLMRNNISIDVNQADKKIAVISITKKKNDAVDLKKTIQGLLPNLIHFLDSQILLETRLGLKKLEIDTLGIHDCIIVDHKFYNECLNEYNKNLSELCEIDIFDILNVKTEEILEYLQNTNKKKFKKFTEDLKLFSTKPLEKDIIVKAKFSLLPT